MNISDLPAVNATLNAVTGTLLLYGFVLIKKRNVQKHKKVMLTALVTSGMFLISYLVYHFAVGSVPYPRHDWTRIVYFAVLIPHTILATVMTPFIIVAVWRALQENFEKHRRIVRWIWPVWMFVSVSGVIVYFMLYHLSQW